MHRQLLNCSRLAASAQRASRAVMCVQSSARPFTTRPLMYDDLPENRKHDVEQAKNVGSTKIVISAFQKKLSETRSLREVFEMIESPVEIPKDGVERPPAVDKFTPDDYVKIASAIFRNLSGFEKDVALHDGTYTEFMSGLLHKLETNPNYFNTRTISLLAATLSRMKHSSCVPVLKRIADVFPTVPKAPGLPHYVNVAVMLNAYCGIHTLIFQSHPIYPHLKEEVERELVRADVKSLVMYIEAASILAEKITVWGNTVQAVAKAIEPLAVQLDGWECSDVLIAMSKIKLASFSLVSVLRGRVFRSFGFIQTGQLCETFSALSSLRQLSDTESLQLLAYLLDVSQKTKIQPELPLDRKQLVDAPISQEQRAGMRITDYAHVMFGVTNVGVPATHGHVKRMAKRALEVWDRAFREKTKQRIDLTIQMAWSICALRLYAPPTTAYKGEALQPDEMIDKQQVLRVLDGCLGLIASMNAPLGTLGLNTLVLEIVEALKLEVIPADPTFPFKNLAALEVMANRGRLHEIKINAGSKMLVEIEIALINMGGTINKKRIPSATAEAAETSPRIPITDSPSAKASDATALENSKAWLVDHRFGDQVVALYNPTTKVAIDVDSSKGPCCRMMKGRHVLQHMGVLKADGSIANAEGGRYIVIDSASWNRPQVVVDVPGRKQATRDDYLKILLADPGVAKTPNELLPTTPGKIQAVFRQESSERRDMKQSRKQMTREREYLDSRDSKPADGRADSNRPRSTDTRSRSAMDSAYR